MQNYNLLSDRGIIKTLVKNLLAKLLDILLSLNSCNTCSWLWRHCYCHCQKSTVIVMVRAVYILLERLFLNGWIALQINCSKSSSSSTTWFCPYLLVPSMWNDSPIHSNSLIVYCLSPINKLIYPLNFP